MVETLNQEQGKSRFVSNTAALGTSTVLAAVLTLVQVKVLSTFLPQDIFGVFVALRGMSLLISLLAANGFPQLLLRYLPFHESKKQTSGALVLSGVCFLAPLFLLTVLVFIAEANRTFFFQFIPAGATAGSVPDAAASGMFLWFYACTLGVTLKLIIYGGLNGIRRLPLQVAIEVVSLLAQVLWIYLWRDRLNLSGLFMILAVTSLAASVVGLPWYFVQLWRDTTGATSPRGNGVKGSSVPLSDYRSYWLGATGLSLVAVAFTDVDRYLLTQVLALEMLALYHIGSRVLRMANRFMSVPVLSFQPEVTRLDTEKRSGLIASSTRVFFKFNSAIAWMAALSVWAFAPEIIRLVSSDKYLPAVPLLRIMILAMPLTAMTAPLTSVMKAVDRVRYALYCDLAWAVVYLGLLFFLGGRYGLSGVGFAHVIASACQLGLAAALSKDVVPTSFVFFAGAKTFFCGIAFAPVLAGSILLPESSVAVVVKVVLLLVSAILFKIALGFARDLTRDEKESLVALLDKPGIGAIARRII